MIALFTDFGLHGPYANGLHAGLGGTAGAC